MIKINQTYVVKAGDTLYGISNQFGVSVTELADLNNVNAANLQIGQVLTIPSASGTNPNNMFMYTIQNGDTLYSIAKKYNTTVQEIIDLNYLKNNNLSIGQIIRIPEMYTPEDQMVLPNYINYTVKRGDNLYTIARNNNISVYTLMKDNALTDNNLKIGQTLKIRVPGTSNIVEDECFGVDYIPPASPNISTINYVVKKGDNLYTIARKFNITVSEIMNLNNLKSTNLSIGQQLKIPSSSKNNTVSKTYIVKNGDNLYSIARQFNTTIDNIKRKNNLKTNLLSIGQKLII